MRLHTHPLTVSGFLIWKFFFLGSLSCVQRNKHRHHTHKVGGSRWDDLKMFRLFRELFSTWIPNQRPTAAAHKVRSNMQKHERHLDEKKGRGRESNSKQHRHSRDHSWKRRSKNSKKRSKNEANSDLKTKKNKKELNIFFLIQSRSNGL